MTSTYFFPLPSFRLRSAKASESRSASTGFRKRGSPSEFFGKKMILAFCPAGVSRNFFKSAIVQYVEFLRE